MPMNSLFEMANHSWLFGLMMCDVFHAMDILASTASIWNLCVISLDRFFNSFINLIILFRYMAGQDPIGYRDKVSKRRILVAILCVWVLSAILSFPGIVWWRTSSPHLYEDDVNRDLWDNKRKDFTDSLFVHRQQNVCQFFVFSFLLCTPFSHSFCVR